MDLPENNLLKNTINIDLDKNSSNNLNVQQTNKSFQRLPAVKVLVRDLIEGDYVKEEGWEPNYVLTKNRKRISRSNIIGIVISKETFPGYESIVVDDKSSSISVRNFEKDEKFSAVGVGDAVLVIGRPRVFGAELYVLPEIIKKQNIKWVQYRLKELGFGVTKNKSDYSENFSINHNHKENSVNSFYNSENLVKQDTVETDIKEEQKKANIMTDNDKIISVIRALDKGDGAVIEDVLSMYKKENGEALVSNLVETGNVFEFKPGKLKILE